MAAVVVAMAVWVVGPPPAGALDVRVQGRSELDARVETAGTRIVVRGSLRDDLGQPLPQRTVGIALFDADDDRRIEGRAVQSDRRGEFRVPFDVMPGRYRITLRFEATTHVTGTVFDRTVTVERQPVDLQVRAPKLVHGDGAAVELLVSASVEGVGLALPVEVETPSGRTLHEMLDDRGHATVAVTGKLASGVNRFRVVVPKKGPREAVSETVTIRKVEEMAVEARVAPVFERLQRGAAIDGVVRDGEHPLSGVEVEATLAPVGEAAEASKRSDDESRFSKLTERAETDEEGRFHVFFGRENLPDGEWRARVRLAPEVGPAVEQTLGRVTIDRSWSRLVVNGAAGLAALVLLLVAGNEIRNVVRSKLEEMRRRREESRRRDRAFREEETLEAMPAPSDRFPDVQVAEDRRLGGEVWDGWDERPVSSARLELSRLAVDEPERVEVADETGRFSFGELGEGHWELVVTADYYVRGRFTFEIPHDGSLANCRFELVPVPLKIRRLYQSLVELARGEDLWGARSPREIRNVVAGVLESETETPAGERVRGPFVRRVEQLLEGEQRPATPVEILEALTDIVQETYFGPRRYDEETWRVAREIAVRLREEIEDRET